MRGIRGSVTNKPTPWCTVVLEHLIVIQTAKKLRPFMKTEDSSPSSERPPILYRPLAIGSSPHLHPKILANEYKL